MREAPWATSVAAHVEVTSRSGKGVLLKTREYPAMKRRLLIANRTTRSGVCNEEIRHGRPPPLDIARAEDRIRHLVPNDEMQRIRITPSRTSNMQNRRLREGDG